MDNELRLEILRATTRLYDQKGMKFTMDDIAHELSISKKTIYRIFENKEVLFSNMVDYIFDEIALTEDVILRDESLTTEQKLRRFLGVLPETFPDVDFRHLHVMKGKYPHLYKKVQERLQRGWDNTFQVIRKGIDEGVFRNFNVELFKIMKSSTTAMFLSEDILLKKGINYQDAINEMVEIMVDGIIKR